MLHQPIEVATLTGHSGDKDFILATNLTVLLYTVRYLLEVFSNSELG